MDKEKKQRIRELEREYLKLSRKETRLIRKQQNYLIDTIKERKKLQKPMKKILDELKMLKKDLLNYAVEILPLKKATYKGDTAIFEINLIDFKCKKVVETANFEDLIKETQNFFKEEARKLEEKDLLPEPTLPIFLANDKVICFSLTYKKTEMK